MMIAASNFSQTKTGEMPGDRAIGVAAPTVSVQELDLSAQDALTGLIDSYFIYALE